MAKDTNNEETVVVKASELKQLLQDVKDLKESNAKLNRKVDFVGDKGRLNRFDLKQSENENLIRIVNVRKFDGKVVLGHMLTENRADVVNGIIIEKQTLRLFLESGDEKNPDVKDIPYSEYYNKSTIEPMEITGEEKGKEGHFLKLKNKEGKQYVIGIQFVN